MRKLLTSAIMSAALVAGAVGVAAPADAQRWHGGYRGWHRGGGGVAVAGIIGLGVGAAIASRPYYGGYYGYRPGYYAPPPPPYAYGYCHSEWRWNGWRGRYDRVRFCN